MTYTIGHRGSGFLEPENTLRGIRKGIDLGMDFIEIDVRETKDGEIVVFHDETLERTTNGKGNVRDFTFGELQELDAGKGEKIPLLGDAIAETMGRARLIVEVKERGCEEQIAEAIKIFKAEDEVMVSSFFPEALQEAKKHGHIDTCLNTRDFESDIGLAEAIGASFISPSRDQTTSELVAEAHDAGLMVFVGPCDTREDIELIAEYGCDAITSNKPDLLAKVLQ